MIKYPIHQHRRHSLKAIVSLCMPLIFLGLHLNAQVPIEKAADAPAAPSRGGANAGANPAAAPARTETPVISPLTSEYVLQPSDAVQIVVFREADLSIAVRLNADGSIMYPLIGRVELAGLTVQKAQDLITKRLGADYLVNPQVTMTVIDYTKKYFTVLGQVARPGSYEIPADGKVTLLQAIGMAGGFTRMADPGHVLIKRVIENKQHKIIKANAKKLAQQDSQDGFPLQAGDTVTVPESWF